MTPEQKKEVETCLVGFIKSGPSGKDLAAVTEALCTLSRQETEDAPESQETAPIIVDVTVTNNGEAVSVDSIVEKIKRFSPMV